MRMIEIYERSSPMTKESHLIKVKQSWRDEYLK